MRLSKLRSPYWLFLVLLLGLAGLQYRLWVGDGSLAQVRELEKQIADQQGENQRLLERNRILEAEVAELKKGTETVEERAVSVADFLATVVAAVGIDPTKQNQSNVGRPIRIADPTAKVVKEALS